MITRLFVLVLALAFGVATVSAQNAGEIRRRMEQRLPQLDDAKGRGQIGENNRGFVEIREAGDAAASTLVSEENRDREAVYALIAKETGATPEAVGRKRAQQIVANSRSGVWVQDERGQWVKK